MESLTGPAHRRKLSNAGGVLSFSSKDAYDDVLAAPASALRKFKPPARVEDYGEIFGGGSRGLSIPVLDLSALDEPDGFRSSKLDYAKIFGGFGDEDVAVPYEEVVNNAAKTGKVSSDKAKRNKSGKESTLRGSNNFNLSGKNEMLLSTASDQPKDCMKQFNVSYHKTSQRSKDGTKGIMHIAKLGAVPGFTHFVDETQHQCKTEGDRHVPSINNEVHHSLNFNGDIHEENDGRKNETCTPDKLISEGVVRGIHGRQWDESHSDEKLFNASESNFKSYSLKSSSSPPANLNDSKFHSKLTKSMKFASKANPVENTAGDYASGSDEEIDINSAAAASAAALKKAIEKAQESIRLAKELMERKKDGLQGLPKPSSKGDFKVKHREVRRISREAKNIKKNDDNDRCERSGHVLLQGFNETNRGVTSGRDVFATTFVNSHKLSTSREAEVEKHHGNITEIHAEATWLLDPVNNAKHHTTTLPYGKIENKNIPLQSVNEQACHFYEMEMAGETLEQVGKIFEKTKAVEKDSELRNAEKKAIFDQCMQESKETVNKSDSAPIVHENEESAPQENIPSEDIQYDFFEQGNYKKKMGVCLDKIEEDKHTLKESYNLLKKKHPFEAFEQVLKQTKSETVHELEENDVGPRKNSCSEGGWMLEEEYRFVENDDKPTDFCGSGSCETTYESIEEGEDCNVLHFVQEREIDGLQNTCSEGGSMGQEEAHQFVENDDKQTESFGSGNCETTYEGTQKGEHTAILDLVQETEIDELEVIDSHDGEETWRMLEEELEGTEGEELDLNEKETVHAPEGENYQKILKEDYEGEEFQKQPEETDNYLEAKKIPEEEFDWEEVEKRIREACINEASENIWRETDERVANQHVEVMQEAKVAESIQFKAGNLDNNQDIDYSLPETDDERDYVTAFDANTTLHEIQEACAFEVSNDMERSQDVIRNYEDNSCIPEATEAFYKCEVDADEGEAAAKEAINPENKEISETVHFVRSPFQEHLCPGEMPSASTAVDFDGNGAQVHHNEMNHAHNVSNRDRIETPDLVQNDVTQNDINIKMQDLPKANPRNEQGTDMGSFKNGRQKEMEKNIKEPELSFNSESGSGLIDKSRENAEKVKENKISFSKEEEKLDPEVVHKERNVEEDLRKAESTLLISQSAVNWKSVKANKETTRGQNIEDAEKYHQRTAVMEGEETRETLQKEVKAKGNSEKIEAIKRDREWEKDRIAVERAIREARERAFAEARERAERATAERAAAEARKRVMAEAREKLEKATAGSRQADKASIEAKLRAERAAVERATAEARERALEKALSQKTTAEARMQTEKLSGASRYNGLKHSFSSSDMERVDGTNSESAQRRKARLERHQRIMERVGKALAEKNKRDILAEKEQAERNRLAESLDADVKRWASGKEGNLRALLSTLHYILGPDSGWQPIPLSDIVTTAAIKKAYRKATLYVHPDKLQQRGASIRQKYICEKVFDLLKAAWSKL